MSYFQNVPLVPYRFGRSNEYTLHQDLTAYVDIVDQVRDVAAFYQEYYIMDGDRPDTLSFKLYGDTKHYWTFYLMNDKLRERGWPLTDQEVETFVQSERNNTVLTTRDDLTSIFRLGSTVTGVSSGVTGRIIKRKLDLGQIFVDGLKDFNSTEDITVSEDDSINQVTLVSSTYEYNAVDHYEDSTQTYVDVNPYTTPGAQFSAVSYHDRYVRANDDLREIIVIKPDAIDAVFERFQNAMRS